MASNKAFRFGPVALGTSVADLLNPPDTTAGVGTGTPGTFIILRHIQVVNRTASPAVYSMYLGATGASASGTEVVGAGKTVLANSTDHWYGALRLDVADLLTGNSGTANALVVTGEGEIGIA